MYRCHRWTPALLLMVLFAMQSTASNAESRIGVAASTRPNAEGVVGANSQTLSPGSELYANETVRTGNRGASGPGASRQHQFDCWTHVRGPARQVRIRSDGFFGQRCFAGDTRRIPICYGLTRPPRLSGQHSVWDAWRARSMASSDHREKRRSQLVPPILRRGE